MDYALPKETVLEMAQELIDKALVNWLDIAITAADKATTGPKTAYYMDFLKKKIEKENNKLIKSFNIELRPMFDSKKRQTHIVIRNHETKERLKEVICYDEAWH